MNNILSVDPSKLSRPDAASRYPWKTILTWGIAIVAVLMLGAVVEMSGASGTCMFILVPYFAALAATYPLLALDRFGVGILVFIPYAVLGFPPLYFFDWLQSRALIGLWAVFVWALSGPFIGLCLDLTNHLGRLLSEKSKAILIGAMMQVVTFFVMLVGLGYLYTPSSSMAGHFHFFSREWYFTLPWMAVNGAFGGYTAYALSKLRTSFQ